jgi:hypothetical protein
MDDSRNLGDGSRPAPPSSGDGLAKRTYSKPILTDYGTIVDLTRGNVGTADDAKGKKKLIIP